jgi:hypothetical protein
MGKILDLLLANSWEEYQRMQLYKKLGKKFDIDTKLAKQKIKNKGKK